MPTYKNNTNHTINYVYGKNIYTFPPKKEYACNFWVPYEKLGLELVNADYPPVPSKVLVSGTFDFIAGMERKFNIECCRKYKVTLKVFNGSASFYSGNSPNRIEVTDKYVVKLDWSYAPYIRVVGLTDQTRLSIYVENEDEA